jgi:hypothetical protein
MWGCIVLLLGLFLAFAVGFELVGKFCVFASFASILTFGLRNGCYESWADSARIPRSTRPVAFWTASAVLAALAAASLFYFIEALRTAAA